MKRLTIEGVDYRLPNALNAFQLEMYLHLILWKWAHITREPGTHEGVAYDAILPEWIVDEWPVLYPDITAAFRQHHETYPFHIHKFFNHMASSQAANVNLFLPILLHQDGSAILGEIKPDMARIATAHLDHGYHIEFWDEPFGNLGDKTETTGTDADLAIAYENQQGELCLWLIEHKLTEQEFTPCGGYESRGRQARHDCSRSFGEISADKGICYYHDVRKFQYWNITAANLSFFVNHASHAECPFRGGMNQLWRNQLLALSIEQDERQPYQHVYFSVVRHPGNHHLDRSLAAYWDLIGNSPKFSIFTSAEVIAAANRHGDTELHRWVEWYRTLYKV